MTALPSLAEAKAEARRLRADAAGAGRDPGHAGALEQVARRHGFRDWNALHAAIAALPPAAWVAGGRVAGRYLGQPFTATVRQATALGQGWFRLELDLDEAVDVVRFTAFSNLRKRLRVEVGPKGHSRERLSDGEPQITLEM